MIIMKLFSRYVATDQLPSLRPRLLTECCTRPSANITDKGGKESSAMDTLLRLDHHARGAS
jgi:hypothetical protein